VSAQEASKSDEFHELHVHAHNHTNRPNRQQQQQPLHNAASGGRRHKRPRHLHARAASAVNTVTLLRVLSVRPNASGEEDTHFATPPREPRE
jgi:hypothetical protein